MEGGYKNAKNEWVADDRFDCFFVPISNHDRYYFTISDTPIFIADADFNILSESPYVQKICRADGYNEPISFWCHEVPYLENGAFVETIVGKSTNGFLRSSSQNAFPPMFNIGRDRGEGKAYEAIFLGDTLISPDTAPGLGPFFEDRVMNLVSGRLVEAQGFFSTGTLYLKKGTIFDVTCTNLRLNIRGFTAHGIFFRANQTRFEFPADFVGAIDYHLDSWNWSADIPDIAAKDEHFFIRVITPEEQKNNPWKGKIWYSYGTSISDIGIGDVVGNNGHSGKWPLYLDAVSGMERRNGAIGSGGIREGAEHGANVKARLLTTPYDCDLVTLEVLPNDGYGTHDGEITDTDPTTICGAFRECCEYITKHTRAKFVVLFVTSVTSDRNNGYAPYAPMSQNHINYRRAADKLRQIAEFYGVAVIDAERDAINWWHKQKGITVRDQAHLNYLGGEILGRYIWGKLIGIDPYPKFLDITNDETE